MAALALKKTLGEDGKITLTSTGVGRWCGKPKVGDLAVSGKSLGSLQVLGRQQPLVVPEGVRGIVLTVPVEESGFVQHGQVLVTVGEEGLGESIANEVAGASQSADGSLVFTSSSSGRFYGRPSPDKPAFVEVGDIVETGQTIYVLEVMKTFSRVAFGGEGLPERAKVIAIVPTDGEDLESGQIVLKLAPV